MEEDWEIRGQTAGLLDQETHSRRFSEEQLEKGKRRTLTGLKIAGLVVLVLLLIWVGFSVFLSNSWLFGVDGLDIIKPKCDPVCPDNVKCVWDKPPANIIDAWKKDNAYCDSGDCPPGEFWDKGLCRSHTSNGYDCPPDHLLKNGKCVSLVNNS